MKCSNGFKHLHRPDTSFRTATFSKSSIAAIDLVEMSFHIGHKRIAAGSESAHVGGVCVLDHKKAAIFDMRQGAFRRDDLLFIGMSTVIQQNVDWAYFCEELLPESFVTLASRENLKAVVFPFFLPLG